jgi:hypothetical protein
MKRLKAVNVALGRSVGPAFINQESKRQSTTAEMNDLFLDLLMEILEEDRDLFATGIQSPSDLHDKYNVFRLFRRGS